jgi:hypothetical protein
MGAVVACAVYRGAALGLILINTPGRLSAIVMYLSTPATMKVAYVRVWQHP